MKIDIKLAKQIEGINTIKSLMYRFGVDRTRAIKIVYFLRKRGYVETRHQSNNRRVYIISPENALKGKHYIDVLNENSRIKLGSTEIHSVYGKKLTLEETIIYAIKQRDIRWIISCLDLFRKVTNWSLLYRLAKREDIIREVVALYDISRLVVRKVRRMPKRFKTLATPKRQDKYKYIVDGFSSLHFQNIEKKWKVYIPLNWGDLEEYKWQ